MSLHNMEEEDDRWACIEKKIVAYWPRSNPTAPNSIYILGEFVLIPIRTSWVSNLHGNLFLNQHFKSVHLYVGTRFTK